MNSKAAISGTFYFIFKIKTLQKSGCYIFMIHCNDLIWTSVIFTRIRGIYRIQVSLAVQSVFIDLR